MRTVSDSIHVAAPALAVFAVLDEPTGYHRFFVGVERWRPLGAIAHDVGDRYHMLMQGGAITAGATVEITERIPGAVLAWRSLDGPAHTVRWTLSPEPGGTRVDLHFALALPGLAARVVERLATTIVRRHITAVLESLRHLCEYELPDAATTAYRSVR